LTRYFWKYFFQLLLVVIAVAQWVCAAWLLANLAGVHFGPLVDVLAPLAIYLLNRWLVRRRPPTRGTARTTRRVYTATAFACVFGSAFLLLGSIFWTAAWAGLHVVGLAGSTIPADTYGEVGRFLGTAGMLGTGAVMAYGYTRGQSRVWTNDLDLTIVDLPAAMEGLRLIQISDIHLGMYMDGPRISQYVDRVNALDPDVIVITGDITDGLDHAPETFPVLAKLEARLGVFAILGNHDVYTGVDAVLAALGEYTDFTVLCDDVAPLRRGDAELWIIGMMDRGLDWARGVQSTPLLDELCARVPPGAPKILLSHRPDLFEQAVAHGIALTLSGHTHGGQLAIPWRTGRKVSLARFMTRYPRGTYRVGDSYLHVNVGLGVTGQPVRVATPREITVFSLHAPV
jgi:predicted MPP superfamily phosphohydrolase